jgi:hypothetical protein
MVCGVRLPDAAPLGRARGDDAMTMREQMTADERREAERFAKATKVDAEGYTGAVYCPDGPPSTSMVEDDCDESRMHLSLADFFDACREAGEEPPPWVWACTTETPRSDARWIVEIALEDHHDGGGSIASGDVAHAASERVGR